MTFSRSLTAFLIAASAAFSVSGTSLAQEAVTPAPDPAAAAIAAARFNPPAIAPESVLNNPEQMLALDLSTGGRVVIQLRPDVAPQHVERIKFLARQGFYNGLTFHRVIEGFMAQGGDPAGNGSGGSAMPNLVQEFNGLPHVRGALSMARPEDRNGANSQFYIMLLPRLSLDRNYTVFGRVVSGIEFVDRIQRGEPPVNPSRIVQASVMADNVPMPPASALTEAAPAAAAPITADQLNAPIGG